MNNNSGLLKLLKDSFLNQATDIMMERQEEISPLYLSNWYNENVYGAELLSVEAAQEWLESQNWYEPIIGK